MKAELKQIGRGISATATAAAAAAEEVGMWELTTVGFVRQARKELVAQCANDALEADYFRHLASSHKFSDVVKVGELAASALIAKWSVED
jgi:hypothetical protein